MIKNIEGSLNTTKGLKELSRDIDLDIDFYTLVFVLDDQDESPHQHRHTHHQLNISSIAVFTSSSTAESYLSKMQLSQLRVRSMMLGTIIEDQKHSDTIKLISINPDTDSQMVDNFIFVPFLDQRTQQKLISPADEAISLLSIDRKAHHMMGAEITFFSINNKFLPENEIPRSEILADLVDDLSYIIPRISMPKGSINFICLILNLDNPVEEKAFIRKFELFDNYGEVLYVTSDLKLQTGDLTVIEYNGANLEGIYRPIYQRQRAQI